MANYSRKSLLISSVVTLAAVGLALALTINIKLVGDHGPLALFFIAVAVSTWFGGAIAGAVALALSEWAVFLFVLPLFYAGSDSDEGLILLFLFASISVVVIFVSSKLRSKTIATSQAAIETEARLKQIAEDLTENSLDLIYTHDLEGNLISVNRYGLELTGYSIEETQSLSIRDVLTPESMQKAESIINALLEGELPEDRRMTLIAKDGKHIEIDTNVWLVYENGRPVGVRGIGRDMTSRNQALLEKSRSEERYQLLVENAQDAIFTLDMAGNLRAVNSYASSICGYSTDELMKGGLGIALTPESMQLTRAMTEAKLRGLETTSYEVEMIAKDGSSSIIEVRSWLIYEDGKPIGINGIGRNITDQKKALDLLKRSEERYRKLVENSRDIIFTHDLEGKFTSLNGFNWELSGYTMDEVMDLGFPKIMTAESVELVKKMIAAKLNGEEVTTYQVEMVTKDGSIRAVEIKSWLIREDGKPVGIQGIARDVTEQSEAQARLRRSEERYRSLVENAQDIIYAADINKKVLSINDYVTTALGYSVDEIFESGLDIVIPEGSRRFSDDRLAAKLAGERSTSYELELATKDGVPKLFDVKSWLTYENGVPIGIQGIARDMTTQKKATELLRRSEERYRSLVDNARDIIYTLDLEGNFTSIDGYQQNFAGYDKEEAYKLGFINILTPKSAEQVRKMMAAKIGGEDVTTYQVEVLTKDGSITIVEIKSWVLFDNGKPVGFQGFARDVTEQKEAQDKLKLSEERYRSLVENAQDMVFTLDMRGRLKSVNDYAIRALGYRESEVWDARNTIFPPEAMQTVREMIAAKLNGELTTSYELNLIAKDGSNVAVEVRSWLNYEDGKPIAIQGIARDITKQKKALESLARSEERYRTLVENARDFIYSHDSEGRFTSINRYAAEVCGYSIEEALTMKITDIAAPESVEIAREMSGRHLRGEYVPPHQVDIITRDGERLTVSINSWIDYVDGVPVGVEGIGRDITAEKKAQLAVTRSEEQYRALVENAQDIIYTVDLEGRVRSVNDYITTALGYTKEEILESGFEIAMTPEAVKMAREMIQAKIHGKRATSYDLEMFGKDGTSAYFDVKTWLIDEDGTPVGIQGIARDITMQKIAIESLERSEERYRNLVENAHDIIYSHDFDGNYTAINQYAADVVGMPVEDILSMNIYDAIDPAYHDVLRETCERHRRGESVPIHQVELVAPDNRRIMVSVNSWTAYSNGVAVGVEGIARDVTEIVKLEERLRVAQKMEAIGTLAGGIAHDFNNMMTVVTGYSELALAAVGPDDPLRDKLELIKHTGDRAAELTHQLLAFSRKQTLLPKPVDLNAIISGLTTLLDRLIPENISVSTSLSDKLSTIMADPGQIEQVILNLAVHARDQMPNGGKLTIETKNVELSGGFGDGGRGGQKPSFVMLSLTDTGLGLDEDSVRQIFDPYFSVRGLGQGSGLGLAPAHGIIKQSGGEITVRSEVGKGTTFDIMFPAAATSTQNGRHAGFSSVASGSEVVLVVEDNEIVRPVVMEMLKGLGYQTISASGGPEAIAICRARTEKVDLILTDVVMPEMSGRELMDELQRIRPGIKGIFMSGYTDDIVFADGAVEPGSAFLGKPFTVAKLNEKIREVLDEKADANAI